MKTREALKTAAKLLMFDKKSIAIVRWRLRRGDKTLRLDYPLTSESVVFDVGGYRGDWADAISRRFGCTIHVFEPVPEFFEIIRERLASTPRIILNEAGLSNAAGRHVISIDEESSSVERATSGNRCEIELLDVHDYVESRGIRRVDLIKINIEGGEYALLQRMHDTDLLTRCTDVQIQFHDFVPDAQEKRQRLRDLLSRTHQLTYDYPFIWENWHLRAAPGQLPSWPPKR